MQYIAKVSIEFENFVGICNQRLETVVVFLKLPYFLKEPNQFHVYTYQYIRIKFLYINQTAELDEFFNCIAQQQYENHKTIMECFFV